MTERPLSPQQSRVKELTEVGLTPREIADALGVSTQRIYQHLHKLELAPAKKASS